MGEKYVIELEDEVFYNGELPFDGSETLYRVKGFRSLVFDQNGLERLTPYIEPDDEGSYNRGLNDAWNCVQWLWNHNRALDVKWDVKRMIEEYKKQSLYEEEFQVGDEIETLDNANKAIVTYVYMTDGAIEFMYESGIYGTCPPAVNKYWRKTGRHYPQIAEVLDAMHDKIETPPEDMDDICVHCKYANKDSTEYPCIECVRDGGTEERWVRK